jgi:hypothetical protein
MTNDDKEIFYEVQSIEISWVAGGGASAAPTLTALLRQ